jgi:hypothetical protein
MLNAIRYQELMPDPFDEILSAYFLDQTSVHAKVGGHRVSFIPTLNEVDSEDSVIGPNGIMF